jgi:4-alpha-glucanotransferase
MRVLQFAFAEWPNNMYFPHNYIQNCIAYTGTHDNNTTSILKIVFFYVVRCIFNFLVAWLRHNATKKEKEVLINYLKKDGDTERGINWDLIRLALASVANTAVLLFQDVLDLEEGCRMNDPYV